MSVSVTRFPVLADSCAAPSLSAQAMSQRNRNYFCTVGSGLSASIM